MKTSLALAVVMSMLLAVQAKAATASPEARPSVTIAPVEASTSQNAVDPKAAEVIVINDATAPKATPSKTSAPKAPAAAAKKSEARPRARVSVLKVPVSSLSPMGSAPKRPVPVHAPVVAPVAVGKAITVAPTVSAAPVAPKNKPSISQAASAEANEIFEACMAQERVAKKSAVTCLDKELSRAESSLDSAEVRLLNCRELRKLEGAAAPALIDSLVTGRMYQLRTQADEAFKADIEAAGKIGPRKTRALELRATLSHLGAVEKLNRKVCDRAQFAAVLSK